MKKERTVGDRSHRKTMIETQHPKLSIRKQSEILGVNRNRLKPCQQKRTEEDYSITKIAFFDG